MLDGRLKRRMGCKADGEDETAATQRRIFNSSREAKVAEAGEVQGARNP